MTTTTAEQFEATDRGLLVRAPGKVNLSLLITGKRPDGFHGIETIMAKINWYDELFFESNPGEGFELVCKGPHWAPEGPENLVLKACTALAEQTGLPLSARVTLVKNMPAGTGLGSASSDCAAALLGLRKFTNVDVPDSVLHQVAAALGSDINFFLGGPLAYCTGRGEKIESIERGLNFCALLVLPDISISTKKVYENYRCDPAAYSQLSGKINPLLQKKKVDSIAEICANMLEESCFRLYPELDQIKQDCEQLCGSKVCLSGSGSALYIRLSRPDEKILQLQEHLMKEYSCASRFVYNNRW